MNDTWDKLAEDKKRGRLSASGRSSSKMQTDDNGDALFGLYTEAHRIIVDYNVVMADNISYDHVNLNAAKIAEIRTSAKTLDDKTRV